MNKQRIYHHCSLTEESKSKEQQEKFGFNRASSSPLPVKRSKAIQLDRGSIGNIKNPIIKTKRLLSQGSSSIGSDYSYWTNYSEVATSLSSAASSRSNSHDIPIKSPQITTINTDDDYSSTSSYYQTPISISNNAMENPLVSLTNSSDYQSSLIETNNDNAYKSIFNAISPKTEDYPHSICDYIHSLQRNQEVPLELDTIEQDNIRNQYRSNDVYKSMDREPNEQWEVTIRGKPSNCNECRKQDSCNTDATIYSMESDSSAVDTFATSFGYSDISRQQTPTDCTEKFISINLLPNTIEHMDKNLPKDYRYQANRNSSYTLNHTPCDIQDSFNYRKSTGDLAQYFNHHLMNEGPHKGLQDLKYNKSKVFKADSLKGGLAYLVYRRNSRESAISNCSNVSTPASKDDVGPLNFQTVKHNRQRRTSNFLEIPEPDHFRPRVCSLPDRSYNPRVSDDLYRLRHFSISKGNVVNCGDSIISRRSRSNNSVNSVNSRLSERSPFEGSCCGAGYMNVDSTPATPDDDSDQMEPPTPQRYRVVMLGHTGVGKTALVNQFMTSEYMHTYDASLDDEFGEKTVSVLLDDEESELVFIDHPNEEMSVENCLSTYEPHGCVVVFSVVDRLSFRKAEEIMHYLWQENCGKNKAIILVGNKADLARARVVSCQEGKSLAASRDAKFIEVSSGIQHNVDELLVGILKQIRLKEDREKKNNTITRIKSSTSRTHISLLLAKEILYKICLTNISKSKSCENLHVL